MKSSKYKGVSYDRKNKNWKTRYSLDGRARHLGVFDTEIGAVEAWNDKMKKLYGELAELQEIIL